MSRNKSYDTALHIAALNGKSEVVDLLVSEFSCNPSVKGFNGRTPLHQASQSGSLDLVRKLISDYHSDPMARCDGRLTPLHMAAWYGREEVVRELITRHSCPVDCVDSDGNTPLHMAALGGHVSVVRMLLTELGADVMSRNKKKDTALHTAALNGQSKVVDLLVSEFSGNHSDKGFSGRTPLHQACQSGSLDLVRKLISDYHSDPMARCDGRLTPLHMAAWYGREEVVRELVTRHSCPVDCVDSDGDTPLHMAARQGHVSVVRMLLTELGADVMSRTKKKHTALHIAALNGKSEVVDLLVSEFSCNPSVKGFNGRIPLHHASQSGSLDLVRKLISDYHCDPMARDDGRLTPLHMAAWYGREEVVRELVTRHSCPVDCVDSDGDTPLHKAARGGHVSVVRMLLTELGADVMFRNKKKNTALHIAALNGKSEVADLLVSDFSGNPSDKCSYGRIPLHDACQSGSLDLLRKLISDYHSDPMARDDKGLTPLHMAAWHGREEVVRELVTRHSCPVDCVDSDGDTPLHMAAMSGHVGVVRMLLCEFNCQVSPRNSTKRTPLYYASTSQYTAVVAELNCDPGTFHKEFRKLDAISSRRLSKASLTKVFVIGYPEVGKSTLVQALRNETWFNRNVKESDVPPHTAGIIPFSHASSLYGKVILYDFAGDREYYSSHAAILEKLLKESLNIFLIVFNVNTLSTSKEWDEVADSIRYWLTFLSYSSRDVEQRPQVILIGSHADKVKEQGSDPNELVNKLFSDISHSLYSKMPECPVGLAGYVVPNSEMSDCPVDLAGYVAPNSEMPDCPLELAGYVAPNLEMPDCPVDLAGYVALNCCKTKSEELRRLRMLLKDIQTSMSTGSRKLSVGAKILTNTLERDFQERGASCQLSGLIEHIKKQNISLPTEAEPLCSYLKELHAYGLVLLLDSGTSIEDHWIVSDIGSFLSTIQGKLFSNTHPACDSNLGIIQDSRLQALFPDFPLPALKGCLCHLQYCQEISPVSISRVLQTPSQSSKPGNPDESFLFFPALLKAKRGEVKWACTHSFLCGLGWYVHCTKTFDFFPPRFLHVLLLRLAFTFALPHALVSPEARSSSNLYSRRCTLWKNGIHWLMESGVEAVVEVVKESKGVLVMVRSRTEKAEECAKTLAEVVQSVLVAKSEFCHSLVGKTYLVNPTSLKLSTVPESDQMQLFDTSEVQKVLVEGHDAVSVDGKGFLPSSEICCLQTQTAWSKFTCVVSRTELRLTINFSQITMHA